ncbi:alanine racemase [Aurantibacter crassamenti]|uniref:alanine racemase n=1 Tax=Aurantibacter crassamenti TaxID=1837375 RepID=UPI001939B0D5|nr:alanine racemase [Aurantibacter crassamenti]MBM1105072.1 alanine racemase [Aurantibacter crassamenti]
MPDTSETILEIDLRALKHNFNFLKSKLKATTKFLAVVKAYAYGSDAIHIAKKLETLKVDYFAVAYANEGVQLREAGIKTPILVLHPQPAYFDVIIDYNLEPSLYSARILELFLKVVSEKNKQNYPVHIKFNTGLNRLGFDQKDIAFIAETLEEKSELKIISILSHLAASEDKNEEAFTLSQINLFDEIATEFDKKLNIKPLKHILNTSGIINYPHAQYDMARSGIGLYGYGNDQEVDNKLQQVVTLKTTISQIHKISPNESVGYNRKFVSESEQIIATLPLGHADGIGRQYGNGKTYVSVNGKKALIIGNVCMDMIMIDVTDITCNEGDEVVLFGKFESAEEFAKTANTISYELLTGISQRVKRIVIED